MNVRLPWCSSSRWFVLFGLTLMACGSATGRAPASAETTKQQPSESEDVDPPEAAAKGSACSKSQRRGTYKVQFLAVSSTCPELQPFEEELAGDAPPLGPGCKHDMPDRWSEDGCTIERAYTCEEEGGGTSRTVVTSKQKASDGSVLTGMMSLRLIDENGSSTCQGTYSVLAEREE